ncbi:MAG: hypothetical protein K5776_02820 [Lachnospiraceae bacterium]|nr:hypothetical protein [Lachnospiraceae bacterium]
MKNSIKLMALALAAALCMSACSNSSGSGASNTNNNSNVSANTETGTNADANGDAAYDNSLLEDLSKTSDSGDNAAAVSDNSTVTPENIDPNNPYKPESVDVDLTKISGLLVYSEVYNMMETPEDYLGKTIKVKGLYSYYCDEATNNVYHACIIQDATACCAQGLEFIPEGSLVYPDDFPKAEDEVTVTGIFDTYYEGEDLYCTLRNAYMEF